MGGWGGGGKNCGVCCGSAWQRSATATSAQIKSCAITSPFTDAGNGAGNHRIAQRFAVEADARFVSAATILFGREHVADPDVGQAADDRMPAPVMRPASLLIFMPSDRGHLARNADDQQIAQPQRNAVDLGGKHAAAAFP